MNKPRKGAIARCGSGKLGLITSDAPQEIIYKDGTKGDAWTGIYLEGRVGTPWSSRNPEVIDYLDNFTEKQQKKISEIQFYFPKSVRVDDIKDFIGLKLTHIKYSYADEGFIFYFEDGRYIDIGFSGCKGEIKMGIVK